VRTVEPQVHALTGAYVCHALSADEERDFELHLAQCPDCAMEVAELRETAALLAMEAVQAPPRRMHAAVLATINLTRQLPPLTTAPVTRPMAASAPSSFSSSSEEQQLPSNVVPIEQARSRRGASDHANRVGRFSRVAIAGWAVAAALAGVVGGLSVHSAVQDRQISQADSRATQISALISASDVRIGVAKVTGGGSATVVESRARGQAAITLSGLAALPAGKAYQLWFMSTGDTRSAAVVTASAAKSGTQVLADDLGDTASVAITVEPAGGSARPTTAPVMLMSLPT
jgi:anti-sigma-K factor RskA